MRRNPVFHIAMSMYSLIYFVPLLWMALSALKSNEEIAKDPLSLHLCGSRRMDLSLSLSRYLAKIVFVLSLACLPEKL